MPKLKSIAERCKMCIYFKRVEIKKADGTVSRNGSYQCVIDPNEPKRVLPTKYACSNFETSNRS